MPFAWSSLTFFFMGPLLRPALGALMAFSLAVNLLMLVPTVYMLQIFDRVLLSGSTLTLLAVSVVTFYLFGLLALSEWLRARLLVRVAASFEHAFAQPVFGGLLKAQAFAQSSKALAALTQRGLAALGELRQFLISPVLQALLDLPFMPLFIAVLFLLHPWLGVFALVFFAVQLTVGGLGHARVVQPQAQATLALAAENRFLQASLKNADAAQAMAMAGPLTEKWQALRADTLATHGQAQSLATALASLSKFMRYLQQGLSLGLGAYLVIKGELSPGAMIAANVLTSRALAPVDQLAGSWRQILLAADNLKITQDLASHGIAKSESFGSQEPVAAGSLPIKSPQDLGRIQAKSLTLIAPGRTQPIFQNLSFSLEPGSTTALVGPSGSGKTSLLKAMVGLWPKDLRRGELWLGTVQPNPVNMQTLAPLMGYLPQQVDLFEASVAQNIARMAEPDPPAVVQAATRAGLHHDILRLPAGYDTVIPMQGFVSAGFRQRLGLARALYGSPRLLLLDEPSASLDEPAEKALIQTLQGLKAQGVSIVLASHRKPLIDCADSQIDLSLHNGPQHDFAN